MLIRRIPWLFLAVVFALQTFFILITPVRVHAETVGVFNNDVEITYNAQWINRATIKFEITDLKVNNEDPLSDESKALMRNFGGLGALVNATKVNNADYKDGNLLDNIAYYGADICGDDIELFKITNMQHNTGGDQPVIPLEDLSIQTTSGCEKLFKKAERTNINIANAIPNRDIWFDMTNDDTLERVDTREKFTRKIADEPNKYQNDEFEDCVPNVVLNEAERKGSGNIISGSYDTCGAEGKIDNVKVYRANPETGKSDEVGSGGGGVETDSCEANNAAALAWLFCGMIDVIDKGVTGLSDAAVELLDTNPAYYSNEKLKEVWSYFKNLASFLLIIVGLVMIIGQAVTKE